MRISNVARIFSSIAVSSGLLLSMTAAAPAHPTKRGQSITVLSIEDPFYFQLRKVLPEFEKSTGIHVKLEGVSYNAMHAEMVNASITHSSTFDVLTPDAMWISEFADNGWIVPLNKYIHADRAQVQPRNLIPNVVWSLDEWNGQLYTLPIAAYGMDVLYRTDVFKALHLRMPPTTLKGNAWWTWAQYLKDVKAINGKTVNGHKLYGTVVAGQQPSPIVHMYTQLAASVGARWFKAFPAAAHWNFAPTINSSANVRAMTMFKELYHYSPPSSDNMNWFEAGTAFAQGHVGMMYWWTPYNYLVDKAGYEVSQPSPIVGKYAVGVLPRMPGVKQTTSIGGYGLAISAFSHKKAAAFKFIAWATSAQTEAQMALQRGYQYDDFARYSLYKSPSLIAHYPWLPTQLKVMESGNGKAVRPPIPIYYTLEGLYGTALNQMIRGVMTPSATARNVESEFKSVLGDDSYLPYVGLSYNDTLSKTAQLLNGLAK